MGGSARRSPLLVAAAIGFAWGLAAYSVLWGHTSIVVHRSFVVSPLGTILLLPIRMILWGIHAAEDLAGEPFALSGNNWWIGLAAGAVGSAVGLAVAFLARVVFRRSGGKGVPKAPEGV